MRRPSRSRLAMGTSESPKVVSYSGFTSTATGTLGGTATEGSIIGAGVGSLTLPGNFLTVGKTIRVSARGVVSTQAIPTTLNLRIKLGATTVAATGDITSVASLASRFWMVDGLLTCRTVGSSGTVFTQALFTIMALSSGQGAVTAWEMRNTSAETIATGSALAVGLTADWGDLVTADSTISCTNFIVEALN